ncbi:MAG: response regulator [Cyanobacteria bacterium P01_A01_bin.105]
MGINVLLVEDSPTDASILLAAFEEFDQFYPIEVVQDGFQVTDALNQSAADCHTAKPNLILLDLNLPGKSGHDVLHEIKTNVAWKAIPTIVLSSSSTPEDIQQSYQLHANAYITKPRDLAGYELVAQQIYSFWLEAAQLPIDKN